MTSPPVRWVATEEALTETIEHLATAPAYALDTEFHRERTYYPKAALIQLAIEDLIALIDPLAVDIAPLSTLFDSDAIAVVHAAQQDLEVLTRACGTVPRTLFDTQLAAGFVGYSSPALTNLLAAELSVRLLKGDRLTDWLARPLSDEQCEYAASDVAHLLELRDSFVARLVANGRLPMGARRVRGAAHTTGRPPRTRAGLAADQGPSSPSRCEPRGGPGGRGVARADERPRSTSPCGSCSPTLRSWASPSAHPPMSRACAASVASTSGR